MAEGAPLLRAYGLTLIEGSNPSLSAIKETAKAVFLCLLCIKVYRTYLFTMTACESLESAYKLIVQLIRRFLLLLFVTAGICILSFTTWIFEYGFTSKLDSCARP